MSSPMVPAAEDGQERGRLRRRWSEACHTSPTRALIGSWTAPRSPCSLLLSMCALCFLFSYHIYTWSTSPNHPTSLFFFPLFFLIQMTQGHFSLSHHLQLVLMSPFFLSASHEGRWLCHNNNKTCMYYYCSFVLFLFSAQIAKKKYQLTKWLLCERQNICSFMDIGLGFGFLNVLDSLPDYTMNLCPHVFSCYICWPTIRTYDVLSVIR